MMLWLMEKGMRLSRSRHWYVRWIGKLLLAAPVCLARHIERKTFSRRGRR